MGMRSTGGEIVQVEGGHIVKPAGRKDRHSKVYTSKGPRDRRVRLSAHTAIEFYDVQDRLGYDRPSKAVDWLINKAKPSIDKLPDLPPWHIPTVSGAAETAEEHNNAAAAAAAESSGYNSFQQHSPFNILPPQSQPQLHPQPIEADPIAKFFPTTSSNPTINFENYPSDIISRAANNNNRTEDLGLSLHSFQQGPKANEQHQSTLYGVGPTNVVGGFMVNPQQFLGQGGALLQSGFWPSPPLLRSWSEIPMNQASIVGSRFVSDGLGGFCIPARIQGEDEENLHGVGSNNTSSSVSHNSHH